MLNLSVSVHRESDKKSKLHFNTVYRLNFIPADVDELVFCLLEKLQDVPVAPGTLIFHRRSH